MSATPNALTIGAAVGAPLLLALGLIVPRLRRPIAKAAPWAALPALALALAAPVATLQLPWVLIGTTLYAPDPTTLGFLRLTAVVWLASGLFASSYLAGEAHPHRFWAFFLSSMAGNLGLVLAQDVVGFYALFSLMTFAAYGLIVHDQTGRARRAAGVYFVLAILGELLLLAALLLVSPAGQPLLLERARDAVAASPQRSLLVLLLFCGFGVKAGLVPLHVWLPLAHPVAPTPASAVLSGAMIKAGLLGWLRFLPLGLLALRELGWTALVLGFVAAVLAALVGATQRDAKTVLAYSSISQMGIMTMAVGALAVSPEATGAALPALTFFALHHALAKASLFLGTDLARHAGTRWHARLVFAGLVTAALSISGAPLSSGALAKLALEQDLAALAGSVDALGPMLSIAAVGSALVMVRFLLCCAPGPARGGAGPPVSRWVPWLALIACDALLLCAPFAPTQARPLLLSGSKVWSASWPMLLAGTLTLGFGYARRRGAKRVIVPAGDLLVAVEALWKRVVRGIRPLRERVDGSWRAPRWPTRPMQLLERRAEALHEAIEPALSRYGVIGSLLAALLLLILAVIALDSSAL